MLAPSIAFPENHDMKRLAAEISGGPEAVARHLRNRYALAAFFSAGVLMPIGYEWGYRRALHVVETTPRDRENDTGIDISASIRAINALRAELPAANVEGAQLRISAPDSDLVALARFDTGHPASARHALIVLYNPSDKPVPVDAGTLIARTGGMLGAGGLLAPGKVIRRNELWLGSPARMARPRTEEDLALFARTAPHYVELAGRHRRSLE